MSTLPIGDYALLSDCRSAALVSRAGSVDWLCFPRFDGPAVFARLLDEHAGHFAVRPAGESRASRAYVDQTMALQTTFTTPTGTAVLTDALAVGRNDRGHDLGAGSPGALLRLVACTDGEVTLDVSYAPRPEYGLVHPLLEPVPGGLAARGGPTGCCCRPRSTWPSTGPPPPPGCGCGPAGRPGSRCGTAGGRGPP